MAGYIYNPAESIRQDFQQAQSGLGNIFTQIIQQQQRDYTLAESTFANIEALKKDVNIYGQKSVSAKANALLGNASQAILANGKLDYGKIGEIRQAVSDIKDLKTGYDLAAKEYEKSLQLGVGTKEDLLSFEKYYRELNATMSDENLIKNPRDLQAAFSKVYNNNLDASKKFIKAFSSIAPYSAVKKEIDNSKGGKTLVQVEAPQGWEVNENGASMPGMYKITNPDGSVTQVPYISYLTQSIKATDPTLIPLLREQNGAAAAPLTDEQLIEFNVKNKIKVPTTVVETKTKAQLDIEKDNARQEAFTSSKMEEKYNLERQLTLSAIAENNAQRKRALAEMGGGGTPSLTGGNLSDYGINVNSQGKSVDFGAEIEVRTADPSNPKKTVPFKATGLRTLANGTQQLVGYTTTGKIDEKTNQMIYGTQVAYYPYNKSAQTSLAMGIKNLGKDKEANIANSVYYYNTIPIVKKPAAAPAPTPAPAGAATKKNAYSQYSDKDLLADPGRKKGNYAKMTDAQYLKFLRSL